MGYRNYLHVVDRKKLAKIKKMDVNQLWEITEEEPEEWDINDETGVVSPPYWRDLIKAIGGEELIEVSESLFYRNSDFKLSKYTKKIFKHKEIQKYYNEDTELMIAKPEILDALIEFYISKVKKFYNQLLLEDSTNPKNEYGEPLKPQLERLQSAVKSQLSWLNFVNDSESKWCLSTAWLYEYDVFNLIHIKKMFNPKKQVLIWSGS